MTSESDGWITVYATPSRPPGYSWCGCELLGDRAHCAEFRPSLLHDDLCIDCYHGKGCHRG